MKSIREKLAEIYSGKAIDFTFQEIEKLISAYKSKLKNSNYLLTEKDVILIAYGDHVKKQGENHLVTLHTFLEKHLDNQINTVHLLPFYPYSSDDGFSVIDYYAVNPELGNWKDIEHLAKDYRLMFDAVVNHISSESEWFKEYLNENPDYEIFFVDISPDTDLSEVVRPRALPLLSEFTSKSGAEKHIWTTFSRDQIDLNYENPKVLLQVLDVLLFYISKGAKLIRLDAIGFLWKIPGTSCIHLPQTHAIIQLARLIIEEITKDVVLITETNVPHAENISYFGDGNNEAHMVYNFTLPPLLAYSILKGDITDLKKWATSLGLPSKDTCFFNFTASHDGVGVRPLQGILADTEISFLANKAEQHGGFVSYKNNPDGSQSPYELNCNYMDLISDPEEDDVIRIKKMLLAQGIMLAMPGVPGIYFHSLVGSGNYKDGVEITGQKRTINREKLDYDELSKDLVDGESFRNQYFNAYLKLIETRQNNAAFNPFGVFQFPDLHEKIFVIERFSADKTQKVLALFNLSNQPQNLIIPKLKGKSLLDTSEIINEEVKLEAYEQKWVSVDFD
ncbi:MAG: sugar phosphorylase [Thalassobius sp.]|nr:sugar phosphorylase [Thalassovita sp.]